MEVSILTCVGGSSSEMRKQGAQLWLPLRCPQITLAPSSSEKEPSGVVNTTDPPPYNRTPIGHLPTTSSTWWIGTS